MIDLGALDSVLVDPDARTARVGGGATLGLLDAAATAHGLATPVGTVSDTGVGGLTLGGGMGWLSRKFGLAIDNLLSVRVVTADGEILRAAADENPDLFWAVRGGGGDFGVVTEFEFRLHRVDPMVQMGMFFFPLDRIADVLRMTRDLTEDLDQDLNVIVGGVNAPPAPFVPEAWQGAPGMAIVLVGFDGTPAHAEVARRIRAAVTPVFELVTPMPYAALQQLFDEGNTWGQLCYEKGTYIDDFSDGVIEVLADMVPRKVSPLSQLLFMRLDGRFCEIDEDATAFGGTRTPRFMAFLLGMVPAGADLSGSVSTSAACSRPCSPMPRAAARTSTPCRRTSRTGSARATAPRSTRASPRSRRPTTPATSSTTTRTSRPQPENRAPLHQVCR
jgi:hypothetical protein